MPRRTLLQGIAASLVLIVVLVAGGIVRRDDLRRAAVEDWHSRLTANVRLTQEFVGSWLDDRLADAREAVRMLNPGAAATADEIASGISGASARIRRTGFIGLTVVDRDGAIVASDGRDVLTDVERAAAIESAGRLREAVVAPTLTRDGRARVALVTPMRRRGMAAVVVYDASITLFPFVMTTFGRENTIRTKLIAPEGNAFRILTPSMYPPSEAMGRLVVGSLAPVAWQRGVEGRDTVGIFTDLEGRRIIAAASAIPVANWGVVRTIDLAEAVEPARSRFRSELTIVIALVLVATTVIVAVQRDANKRRIAAERRAAAEEAKRASDARFQAVFDNAATGIIVTDADGAIRAANPAYRQLLRSSETRHEAMPDGLIDVPIADDVLPGLARDTDLAKRASATMERRLRRRDGSDLWVSATVSRLDPRDPAAGRVVMVQDITAAKDFEAQLTHRAFHDSLTNLANRALLLDRIDHALRLEGRRPTGRLALLFIDLDQFKAVNDVHGHAMGDRLLMLIAERLRIATRESDTVARLSGDEFAVLMERVDGEADARMVAERVLESISTPAELDGQRFFPRASIGIALAQGDESAGDLLRFADLAMYQAKRRGKGCIDLYDPSLSAGLLDRIELEGELRLALERREFGMMYQPIVELATDRVTGVEALIRWHHPARGRISPAAFIPLAEESGLIVPIGQWVLGEACAQAQRWVEDARLGADDPFTVSVNISGHQLQHAAFVDHVRVALASSGLSPARLVLEITESVIMRDVGATLSRLQELRDVGVMLAIDDFGTGYSSLSYLRQFPVHVLKIDKSFIDAVEQSASGSALARTIIALGETLGLRTVAEGIEREPQRASLVGLGCGFGQGFYFAQPMTAEEIRLRLDVLRRAPSTARRAQRTTPVGAALEAVEPVRSVT